MQVEYTDLCHADILEEGSFKICLTSGGVFDVKYQYICIYLNLVHNAQFVSRLH